MPCGITQEKIYLFVCLFIYLFALLGMEARASDRLGITFPLSYILSPQSKFYVGPHSLATILKLQSFISEIKSLMSRLGGSKL
jgi:hypothetical protein